jgi:hypothetical protein
MLLLAGVICQPSFSADIMTPGKPKGIEVTVPAGTPVHLVVNEMMGATQPVGTEVTFKVVSDVVVNGSVVIAAEAEAQGHVSEYTPPKDLGIGMADPFTRINLDWVRCVDGRKVHVSGEYSTKKTKVDVSTVLSFKNHHKDRGQSWMINPGIPVESVVETQATVIVPKKNPDDSKSEFAN